MYQPLLTNRYLTSRVIPLIAVAAVALCVALVIIVVSVMTGFLNMVRNSGRTLMGDVVVSQPVSGIPHYQRLIEHITALPGAAAATPVVDSWALLKMPYPAGPRKETETVQLWGIEPASFAAVTGFLKTLWWRPLSDEEKAAARPDDLRRGMGGEILEAGRTLRDHRTGRPGIVLGMHISIGNERQRDGTYQPVAQWWMPDYEVTLTALPIDTGGGLLEPESRIYPIVNEFVSGVFLIDDKRVMIPLEEAQAILHLDAAEIVADDGTVIGPDPARASMVLVRAREGVSPQQLRDSVQQAYAAFYEELLADQSAVVKPPPLHMNLGDPTMPSRQIVTWEQQQAGFIGPIEKERELMRTLFSLVYVVCAGLVLAIFWAIVYEKTRDIGILRSIGASRLGISWIFLRYGLVVGVLGAAAGLGLAYLIVININTIHETLGHPPAWLAAAILGLAGIALVVTIVKGLSGNLLPIVLGLLVTLSLALLGAMALWLYRIGGFVVWDPSIYYFTQIPNQVDLGSAAITMVGAVLFSLVGAFLPAAKAADTDPVKALRYE